MAFQLAPPPLQSAIVDRSGLMQRVFQQWLLALTTRLQSSPYAVATPTELTTQSASIGTTNFTLGAFSAGIYSVTWYARITRAASTSSSLTVTVGHTDTAVSCTQSGAAMTGNTTSTVQSGTATFYSDASGPITYATTYASVGGTSMQYSLRFIVSAVSL